MYCSKCGSKMNANDKFCEKCGEKNVNSNVDITINNSTPEKTNVNVYQCSRCGSNEINLQAINESYMVTKHHGIFWWLIIGWWWIPFKWLCLTVPALIFAIFVGKRKTIKNKQKTIRVCQNCGHRW